MSLSECLPQRHSVQALGGMEASLSVKVLHSVGELMKPTAAHQARTRIKARVPNCIAQVLREPVRRPVEFLMDVYVDS